MPRIAKKECGIILFDINASNEEEALAALIKICTYYWLSRTKDSYRVILSNTNESHNVKNYSNLYDTGISNTNPYSILQEIEKVKPKEGDWLNALLLAIHHLKKAFDSHNVITLHILYITKLDGCSHDLDMFKLEEIISDLNEYSIYLYIIGPNVKLPYTITNNLDIAVAMKETTMFKEENKSALIFAKRIIDTTTNSVICDVKVGINLFFAFKNSRGSRPCKRPLSFGKTLEIPASSVKIYRKQMPFNISKGKGTLKYVLSEDESISVEYAELVSGIQRHGKFVEAVKGKMFQVNGPRSFMVVGFTDSHNIPEYLMRNETYYVLPDEGKRNDCYQALYNLVDVLVDEKKYAIVRRIYYANTKPKFFVLVPQPHLQPKCFVMSALPFADDLRQNFKCSVPIKMEKTKDEVFEQFFDSIDISSSNCKLKIPLGPKMMLDPYISKLANEAAKKYLDRDFPFEELDINDLKVNSTNKFLEKLKASWPIREIHIKNEEDIEIKEELLR